MTYAGSQCDKADPRETPNSPIPDAMEPDLAKCFDCGETFPADEDGRIVTDTFAFCSENCMHAFRAGLGV